VTAETLVRDWGLRVLAVLVFLSAAYLVFVLTNLPVATRVEAVGPWKAARGEVLTLGLAAAEVGHGKPVISLNGPPGKDVGVWFEQAAFSPETRGDLVALGMGDTASLSPAGWVSHAGGSGRAAVAVGLEPTGPRPALSLTPTGHGAVAEVVLRARDARMILRLEASLDPAAPDPELFGPNRAWEVRMTGQGGFPVEVAVPPGAYAVLRMPDASVDAAEFRMGGVASPGQPALLRARSLDVEAPGEGERLAACGARRGAISWASTRVGLHNCQPTLRLVDLELARDGVALEVNGLGFVAEDGEAAVLPLQKITDNPLISIVLGGLYAGIAAWSYRTLMRRRNAQAPPDSAVTN
jgi:hypothetical protein